MEASATGDILTVRVLSNNKVYSTPLRYPLVIRGHGQGPSIFGEALDLGVEYEIEVENLSIKCDGKTLTVGDWMRRDSRTQVSLEAVTQLLSNIPVVWSGKNLVDNIKLSSFDMNYKDSQWKVLLGVHIPYYNCNTKYVTAEIPLSDINQVLTTGIPGIPPGYTRFLADVIRAKINDVIHKLCSLGSSVDYYKIYGDVLRVTPSDGERIPSWMTRV